MLNVIAHQGGPGPHADLWAHWSTDPAVLVAVGAAAWAYHRGATRRRQPHRGRYRSFWIAVVAVGVALVSPIDALAGELASVHMVQHLLLVIVAAPLVAHSAPVATMLRGAPFSARAELGRVRRAVRHHWLFTSVRRPGVAWLLHAGTLWFWHASGPYGAALEHDLVHAIEHATFLLTAVMFWSAVLRLPGQPLVSDGYRALLVFTMAMQSVFLSVLLTFASRPWYDGYLVTARERGLDPLADQQLAGVIMWVPAGLVYVGAGIALVARWVRGADDATGASAESDWADVAAPLRSLTR